MESSLPQFLVVVLGFNRPRSLKRLLASLEKVEPVACKADLVVSLDGGGDPKCPEIAECVNWSHGRTEVVSHKVRMGLKTHVETATDRVKDYDAVIVLEDDLSVSPWMLHYCLEAFRAYGQSDEIAQISLYSHHINEFSGRPFSPVDYGFDFWFSRVPSSWGQMYTRRQWYLYGTWLKENTGGGRVPGIPFAVYEWKHTWKRSFFEYVSAEKRWTAYPYHSLTTNHGDAGSNHLVETLDIEVPLEIIRRRYRTCSVIETPARYDEWFEPIPDTFISDIVPSASLTVDLAGVKPLKEVRSEYLLSSKTCSRPLATFGIELLPLEMNVRLEWPVSGSERISLGRVEDFGESTPAEGLVARQAARGIYAYWYTSGIAQGHREIRAEARYRVGSAIVVPLRRILRLFGLRG